MEAVSWPAHAPEPISVESETVLRAASIANDTSFTSQWSLANTGVNGYGLVGADIRASQAWDVTTGSRSVVVAVIDSGIDLTHPDLAANVWTNPGEIAGNGIDDEGNGYIDDVHGWNFVENNSNVQDGYGHGTHIAGVIGAVGNNGLGIAGINWQVSIMPLRFQDNFGVGNTGGAIAALNYATMMRRDFGINVVVTNNSWGGGTGVSELLREAIRAQNEAGIVFVAAAGNSAADCDLSPRYPACFDLPNVISVAATDRYDNLASFSNYGATSIDLGAPGVGIYSTRLNGTYASMSGTSQAAPQVTGVVALLAAVKPGITVGEIRSAILASAQRVPGLAGKTVTGGRLDAAGALALALGSPVPPDLVSIAPTPTPPPAVSPPAASPPEGVVELATKKRLVGWAFSARAGEAPISVRVTINGKDLGTFSAGVARPDLAARFGSGNHGFDIAFAPKAFHRGSNTVKVWAIDPATGEWTLIGKRIVRR